MSVLDCNGNRDRIEERELKLQLGLELLLGLLAATRFPLQARIGKYQRGHRQCANQ